MKNIGSKASKETLKATRLALSRLDKCLPSIHKATSVLKKRKEDVVVTGIGKSSFIAQKMVATLNSLGVRSSFLHPVEAMHGDLGALSRGDVLIAFSASGESREVLRLAEYAKRHFSVPIISFLCRNGSSLGRISAASVVAEVDEEGSPEGVAPMASTTAMLVLADMLSSHLVSGGFKKEKFARLHPSGSLGLELTCVSEIMRKGKNLPFVKEEDPASKVLREIDKKKLGTTAVVDNNSRVVGAITDGDIRRWALRGGCTSSSKATDMMTRKPKTIFQNSSLKSALRLLEAYKITTLFVVDKKKILLGIVHIHDIVEGNVL